MIDIKKVKEEAAKQFREETTKKATEQLVKQMRIVEQARQVLRAEELKLADIESQIEDGTL